MFLSCSIKLSPGLSRKRSRTASFGSCRSQTTSSVLPPLLPAPAAGTFMNGMSCWPSLPTTSYGDSRALSSCQFVVVFFLLEWCSPGFLLFRSIQQLASSQPYAFHASFDASHLVFHQPGNPDCSARASVFCYPGGAGKTSGACHRFDGIFTASAPGRSSLVTSSGPELQVLHRLYRIVCLCRVLVHWACGLMRLPF